MCRVFFCECFGLVLELSILEWYIFRVNEFIVLIIDYVFLNFFLFIMVYCKNLIFFYIKL